MNEKDRNLFENMPEAKAVLTLAIPTVVSQLVMVFYNMADTFFIGQIGDPNQVAAANICMPLMFLMTGFANLFGVGGSSLISRCLGKGECEKAEHTASFCIWTSIVTAVLYGIIVYALSSHILPLFGANEDTYIYCRKYLFWTIALGATPSILNVELGHLVRAEGHSAQAGFGMILGALINVVLDPLMILVFDMEISGAAIATIISNIAATVYFIILIIREGSETTIALNPARYSVKDGIPSEVLLVGFSGFIMCLMSTASNATLNKLMSTYCNEAIAGVGIAKKIDTLAFGIANGMSQGVVPLVGYNYSAKNFKRMKKTIKVTFAMSIGIALVGAILLFTCAGPIVRAFIDDSLTVQYGRLFQRVMCITGPCISVTLISITVFQSVGKKFQPVFLSMCRKGGLDIPCMFLMNTLVGVTGIVWATPIADACAMLISLVLFIPFWKKNLSDAAACEKL